MIVLPVILLMVMFAGLTVWALFLLIREFIDPQPDLTITTVTIVTTFKQNESEEA